MPNLNTENILNSLSAIMNKLDNIVFAIDDADKINGIVIEWDTEYGNIVRNQLLAVRENQQNAWREVGTLFNKMETLAKLTGKNLG